MPENATFVYEGKNTVKHGSQLYIGGSNAWRLNNPGNARCSSVGYASIYGDVQCVNTASGKFARFPTYEQGWTYLLNLIREKVKENPHWTIRDFMSHYAPTGDNNNPDRYAAYIATRLAVTVYYPMSKIVST